jgi:hypothetical protein
MKKVCGPKDVTMHLKPNYSSSGVYYSFPLCKRQTHDAPYMNKTTKVFGQYYVVAANTTQVLTGYVHNEKFGFLGDTSLDISIGPIGVGVSVGDLSNQITKYYGTPLTLPHNPNVLSFC